MHRAWLSVLVIAVLLAGCSARPSESTDTIAGPSHVVTVKNAGPHDAKITLFLTLPNGSHAKDVFTVKANETVQKRQATAPNASIGLRMEYSWDSGGQAAASALDLSYNSFGCPLKYGIDVQITTASGHTASSVSSACRG